MVAEQQGRLHEQVVEVEGAVLAQHLLVTSVDPAGDLLPIRAWFERVGRDQVVFAAANLRVERLRPVELVVEV